jgi:protein TonB
MKNLKKQPTKQLEKFSNIFMQLGLVLVLFVVFISLEHKTAQKTVADENLAFKSEVYQFNPNTDVVFRKETSRLIKKLLQFTPGQQQNRFVRVRYTLPIAFSVE